MTYEIINPSDPYVLESDAPLIAAVACTLLGEGAYGLKSQDDPNACGIFLFGGHDEWFQEKFDCNFAEALTTARAKRKTLVQVLRSVRIGSLDDPNNEEGYTRSSLNNIGARAKELAEALEGE